MRPFSLALPATSANLGPAFDAAALALSLQLRVRARLADTFSIRASGRDAGVCSNPDNHLIIQTYGEILASEGKAVRALSLELENEIPIGKGLGSSAAARLAGIAMATYFGRLNWNDSRIIAEASAREHHPDNAAACWMGGLAVARMYGDRGTMVATIAPKGNWPLLLAVPDEPLSTEKARRVLPGTYSRQDAVANVQNSMLLLASFMQDRKDLLAFALDDRFHQPYRAPLCPLLGAVQQLAGKHGIRGAALSGAGPSVLIFLEDKVKLAAVVRRIRAHLNDCGLQAELLPASVANRGARSGYGVKVRSRP